MADELTLSGEERIKIATDFILNAPYGELREVISDVQVLCGGESVLADALPGIVRQYNQARRVIAEGQASKVLLCKEGELADGTYLDAATARSVRVEHVGSRILSTQEAEEKARSPKVEEYRVPAQEAVAKYVSSSLASGCSAVHGSMDGDTLKISVNISGYKLNTRNFWTGHWCSHAHIDLSHDAASGTGTLKGTIWAKVHYYEDGNVHLSASRAYSSPLSWTDAASFASVLARAVRTAEEEYYNYLQDQYAGLPDRIPGVLIEVDKNCAFKSLRRKMPLTQQRFQWDKVAAYSLARELTNK